ncbi:MAG: hypothetical protein LBU91_04910 [Bacteroidales bacterium]|jgi:hypothetical protein|nr:hypothetical protein [Bacteroidales bacterium]
METKYSYNGQDITTDMMFKIEHVVNVLSERENKDFDVVLADFLESNIYHILQQPDNLLWADSSEYIADEYIREITKKTNIY